MVKMISHPSGNAYIAYPIVSGALVGMSGLPSLNAAGTAPLVYA